MHSTGAPATSVVVLAPSARAVLPGTACEDSRVRVEGNPDDRWLEPIVRACAALATMADSDGTAQVRLVPTNTDLIVVVTLMDRRTAIRRVSEPSRLFVTLEALLTLPPPSAAPIASQTAAEPSGGGQSAPAALTAEAPSRAARGASADEELPPGFGVELGGALAGRVSGAQADLSMDPNGFAQLRAGHWLFGLTARWEVLQHSGVVQVDAFEMETVAAGVSAARRFHAPWVEVDIGASPRLATVTQSYQSSLGEKSVAVTNVRLATFVRAAFGQPRLRVFVETDLELSLDRVLRDIRADPSLPVLSAWSAGLALGLMTGAP